ncbi:SURF1 family protein [Luteimonas huabeiensis]|uniref:SURF1 family protein n=1 Tax=Luteimonas huabeiensis TaxID=1244513 RepID=UPI00046713F5|nr:SURF1 family protein [Luteimonas huabeiensis]
MTHARPGASAEASGARGLRLLFAAALAAAFAGFVALGVWQLQRMGWKHALIARVDARIHAAPADPPPRAQWPSMSAARDEYRRVRLSGRYLDVEPARVQAVTELGPGWWLLAPFETEEGDVVLVNRGFVPSGEAGSPPPAGPTTVIGLLRLDEPGGGFLRRNDPAAERWFSRDVRAIAAARGIRDAAPYFVDAERDPAAPRWPAGGLTVVRFRDHHLSYALTWFALALLTAFAGARLYRLERRARRSAAAPLPGDGDAADSGR